MWEEAQIRDEERSVRSTREILVLGVHDLLLLWFHETSQFEFLLLEMKRIPFFLLYSPPPFPIPEYITFQDTRFPRIPPIPPWCFSPIITGAFSEETRKHWNFEGYDVSPSAAKAQQRKPWCRHSMEEHGPVERMTFYMTLSKPLASAQHREEKPIFLITYIQGSSLQKQRMCEFLGVGSVRAHMFSMPLWFTHVN